VDAPVIVPLAGTPAPDMSAASVHPTFQHEALLYDGPEDLTARAAAFVREGLDRGEPVLVAFTPSKLEPVAAELGPDAGRVHLVDMGQVGRNPARLIPALQRFLDLHVAPGAPARGVGEPIWAQRPPDEVAECQLTEELINLAFAGRAGFRLLCAYDARTLASDVLRAARRSHPLVTEDGRTVPGAAPAAGGADPVAHEGTLPPPTGPFDALAVERRTLREARALVARRATEAGLPGWRVQDTVRAVHELAANSVRHGGGHGVLRIWRTEGALVCEMRDRGHIADPLAGRRRPPADAASGRGLWLATQVSDLLQIRTGPDGSVLRLVMRLG
jgi:anti-sigma regulatory factor (Ser/Thr protein kinase)